MPNAKVAVLLSTFNGEKYLAEFLHSLADQEWPHISLVARDDGSSDNTLQVLKRFPGASRINVQILPASVHLGVAHSFLNILSDAGEGFDYYAFADQDDVWLPGKISRAVNKLDPVSAAVPTLYFSRLEYVDEDLNHLKWSRVPRRLGFGNAVVENVATGCTVVLNKSARELILPALPAECLMHDWWCYLTLSCFGQVVFDDYSGIQYRQHGGNLIGAAMSFESDLNRRLKRFFRSDDGAFRFSDQVANFIDNFGGRIPGDQRKLLDLVVSAKYSIKARALLSGSGDIWRQRRFDDFILRMLISINHF
jgi:glycosyltransferase involved in cell wall biosynthesis